MAIITKTGTPAKGDPLQFDLSKANLEADASVQVSGYFSDQNSWHRVVLEYRSSYDPKQSFMIEFDGQEASPSTTKTLPDTFKGNFEILNVKIAGFNGSSLEIPRASLTTAEFDIDCSLAALPVEAITSVTSQTNFDVGDGSNYKAGHRVRLYDTSLAQYESDGNREIVSSIAGTIIVDSAWDTTLNPANHELHFSERDDCNVDQQVNWLFT